MIALFCGSRTWTDSQPIRDAMIRLVRDRGLTTVVHGAQRGADSLAGKEAANLGLQVMEEPAEWEVYGVSAGPIRNEKMLQILLRGAREWLQPVQCFAFHEDPRLGRGTHDMVRRCMLAGIRTHVFLPESGSGECFRASGDCPCPSCKVLYRRHPVILSQTDSSGEPFLHLSCSGQFLKL